MATWLLLSAALAAGAWVAAKEFWHSATPEMKEANMSPKQNLVRAPATEAGPMPEEEAAVTSSMTTAGATALTAPTPIPTPTPLTVPARNPAESSVSVAEVDAHSAQDVLDQSVSEKKEDTTEANDDEYSVIEFIPHMYYSRIDGQDRDDGSRGSLLSGANYGFELKWRQVISPHVHTYQNVRVNREKYLPDSETATAEIKGATQTLTGYGAGIDYHVNDRLLIRGYFGLAQEVFYKGLSSGGGSVEIQPLLIPRFEVGGAYRFWQSRVFYAEAEATGTLYLPASNNSYRANMGYGYQGKLSIGQDIGSWSMHAGTFYGYTQQNTSILKRTRKDNGFELGLSWQLGDTPHRRTP
ncbi:MAG TPA: hypothetical protein VM901_12875 [Bdellovibrionota bacterium]|nr:hypothetical protein [Bdellovibrionota bacterium]